MYYVFLVLYSYYWICLNCLFWPHSRLHPIRDVIKIVVEFSAKWFQNTSVHVAPSSFLLHWYILMCIIHRFTPCFYYKIRSIWSKLHVLDSVSSTHRHGRSWSVSLEKGKQKKRKEKERKALALIKHVLFSSFRGSTYSLALIKTILFSSYRRSTHQFSNHWFVGGEKQNVVFQAHITKLEEKKRKQQEKEGRKAENKITHAFRSA